MKDTRLKRLKLRISQWELAKLTGISQSRISLFERDQIVLKDREIKKIPEVLNIRSESADRLTRHSAANS